MMLFDSCLLHHHGRHSQRIDPTYARHLEFGRVRSLHTFPSLQPIEHHEMRESHWHLFVHQSLNMFYLVEMAHIDTAMMLLDQVLVFVVKSFVSQVLKQLLLGVLVWFHNIHQPKKFHSR